MKKVLMVLVILLLSVVGFSQKFKVGLMCVVNPNQTQTDPLLDAIFVPSYFETSLTFQVRDSVLSVIGNGEQMTYESFTPKEEDAIFLSSPIPPCSCKVGLPKNAKNLYYLSKPYNVRNYITIIELEKPIKKKGAEYSYVLMNRDRTNNIVFWYSNIIE